MSKTMYILRGLSGAGKSTIANILYQNAISSLARAIICCADDFLMEDGEYKWAPHKMAGAHQGCRDQAADAAEAGYDCIIIANTNTTRQEMTAYMTLAEKHGYFLQVLTVGEFSDEAVDRYHKQNVHNVPHETIVKMRDRFKLV